MKYYLITRLVILFCCCTLYAFQCHVGGPDRLSSRHAVRSQNNLDKRPDEPGKCYAKSMIPDLHKTVTIDSMAMYTGVDSSKIMFAERTIQEEHNGTKWVKKKADKNCLSADPNDCLVWCLVEEHHPEVVVKYLEDTSQTTEWEYQTITKEVLIKDGGYSEWKEVICAKDINDRFYMDLKNALALRGYTTDLSTDGFSPKDKVVLVRFQEDNGLPVGQLDLETLGALGIR